MILLPSNGDVELLQQLIQHGGTQAFSLVPAALKNVLEERQWTKRTDKHGQPFTSFEAFAKYPLWHGLGTTIDDLRVHCRKHPEILKSLLTEIEPEREWRGSTIEERGTRDSNPTSSSKDRGALYDMKRLKRERPDLFQVVLGGGMSPNAAAIEAGFREKPTPLKIILRLISKLTDEEKKQLRDML